MIQCSRLAFGYVGIYDQDEAERVVDMGTVQRAPEQEAARPALEHYPAEQFEANFPAWKNAIEAGKRTPEQIVAMVSSKAELTNEQRAQIMALEEGVEA